MKDTENDRAIAIVRGGAAHSDIGMPLRLAADGISDAAWMSGDRSDFPAAGVLRDGQIFAFVEGMKYVTLRLSTLHAKALLELGGMRHPDFSSGNWINITPLDPKIDLRAWLHKAHNAAKHLW
ncbi:hypothetical protein [Yoonia sp. 2307UL14-13]|uniref:hypothetical protein n=1 Tax=Yoonia sp. 2307UL14-13 TaxID=3126506 RepID=UPI00309DC2CD